MTEPGPIVTVEFNQNRVTRRSSGAWFYVHGFAIAVLILCCLGHSAGAQLPFVPDQVCEPVGVQLRAGLEGVLRVLADYAEVVLLCRPRIEG